MKQKIFSKKLLLKSKSTEMLWSNEYWCISKVIFCTSEVHKEGYLKNQANCHKVTAYKNAAFSDEEKFRQNDTPQNSIPERNCCTVANQTDNVIGGFSYSVGEFMSRGRSLIHERISKVRLCCRNTLLAVVARPLVRITTIWLSLKPLNIFTLQYECLERLHDLVPDVCKALFLFGDTK